MLVGLSLLIFSAIVISIFAQLHMQVEQLKTRAKTDSMQMKAEIERLTNRLRTVEKDLGRALPAQL